MTTPSLDSLRDIHGIDSVPWWPLAPGWWLLLVAILGLALILWKGRRLRLRLPLPGLTLGTWRWEAAAALRALRRRARAGEDAKTTASELSALLRRISMARLGRAACAGLTGQSWLDWLTAHDPGGFPWGERGQLLLAAPYAPPGDVPPADLLALIDAAYGWVAAPQSATRRPSRLYAALAAARQGPRRRRTRV